MADNFADFYSGNMAPPLKLPGGGYAPAPSVSPPMSPEEIYQGIYGEPLSLTSVSRRTVPINPSTGMPYATTANAGAQAGLGTGYRAAGSTDMRQPSPAVYQPNGTVVADKEQSRLPALPVGLPLAGTYASAKAGLGAGRSANTSLSMPARASDGIIDISHVEMSDRGAQNTADSEGKPVRVKGGKVYYPGGKAPAGQASGSLRAPDTRGPLGQMLGLKTSGLGGLLGGLFGGGGQTQSGGGLAAMLGGGSSFGSSPSQGQAMIVDPSTSAGSALESMGFSSGGAVPAATIRSLSERGYI